MRLDKFLSSTGYGSRKDVKNIIKKKRIKVDSVVSLDESLNIDPKVNKVYIDDKIIEYKEFVYLLLNKPKGYISATTDSKVSTILDLIHDYKYLNLFPVGRLDKDTTGIILITNDGDLAHNMLSPKKHVEKVYIATLNKPITNYEFVKESLEKGIIINNELTLPASLDKIDDLNYKITLHEGKYHEVKLMFKYFKYEVVSLDRISFGKFTKDNIEIGNYIELNEEEIKEYK